MFPSPVFRIAAFATLCLAFVAPGRAEDAAPQSAALVVRAVAPDDTPLAGAQVCARVLPPPTPANWGRAVVELAVAGTATADAKGEVRLGATSRATWRVEVRAEGRATCFRSIEVDPSAPPTVTMRLAVGCDLSGVVTDDAGEATAGVGVFAGPVGFEADFARMLATTSTDAAGRYRLTGLPRGAVDLFAARTPGGPTWIARLCVPGFSRHDFQAPGDRGGRRVPDAPTGREDSHPRRRSVPVRVLGPDGAAVLGATVTIGGSSPPSDGLFVWPPPSAPGIDVTGTDGLALVGCDDSGIDRDVTATAPGFAPGHTTLPESTDGKPIEIRLVRGRAVVVTVVNGATGDPVPGAWLSLGPDVEPAPPMVSALPVDQQRSDLFVGRTGTDGTFRLTDLGPEAIRVHAKAAAHHDAEARIESDSAAVTVRLGVYATLSGSVLWEDGGRPATGVVIGVMWIDHPPNAFPACGAFHVGPTGRFAVTGLHDGVYEMPIMTPDREGGPDVAPMIAGPFRAGASDIVIRVRPGRKLRGVVLDADGTPVASAAVEVRPRRHPFASAFGEARTGDDGTFSVVHAPHGPVYVEVDAESCGDGGRERRVVIVGPVDPADDPVRIGLGGLAIDGRFTRADHGVVSGTCFAAIPADETDPDLWRPWPACRTDDDGRFHIGGLALGLYRLWLVRDWRRRFGFASGQGPLPTEPLDPGPGVPAGAKDVTPLWK